MKKIDKVTVKLSCGHKKKLPNFAVEAVGEGKVLCPTCKDFKDIKR